MYKYVQKKEEKETAHLSPPIMQQADLLRDLIEPVPQSGQETDSDTDHDTDHDDDHDIDHGAAHVTGHSDHNINEILSHIADVLPAASLQALSALLDIRMNFDSINNLEENIYPEYTPVSIGTVKDYILEQFAALVPTSQDSASTESSLPKQPSPDIDMLKTAAVINGLGRALATKAGDLSARDMIVDKIAAKITAYSQETLLLSRENPFVLYIHDEINSHDAALMVVERAEILHLPPLEFAEKLKRQALLQLMSLRSLNSQKDIAAKRTKVLSVDDAFGLYSEKFLTSPTAGASEEDERIDKIMVHIMHILEGRECRSQGKAAPGEVRAVRKAQMHERKVAGILPGSLHPSSSFLDRAILHIMLLLPDEEPTLLTQKKTEAKQALQEMVNVLNGASITISRFSDSLLAKELKPGSPRILRPGTMPAYITLAELISANKPIRTDFPGIAPNIAQNYFIPRNTPSHNPDEIAFTPFLVPDSHEGYARKSVYPIFRNYKNAVFSGKSSLEPEHAIFGSLCFDPFGSAHGFDKGGKAAGTYGDVTLVLDPSVKSSGKIIYTNTDRGRGYTNLETFVCSLFQSDKDDLDFFYHEQYIKGTDSLAMAFTTLPRALFNYAHNRQADTEGISQNLEVQIFMDLELSKNHIKEVYFASDVPQGKRDQIRAALSGATVSPDLGHPDITFYQYTDEHNFQNEHLQYTLQHLYDKASNPESRTLITQEQLRTLLANPETLLAQATALYSGKPSSKHTPGKGREFYKIMAHLEEYLKSISGGRPYWPRRI